MSKDVLLTPEQIAAEERRWLFDAPIAELAEVKGVTIDEAVQMRTDAVLQEAVVPIEVTVRPIEPQGKLIGFASVNFGGVVMDGIVNKSIVYKPPNSLKQQEPLHAA